MFFESVRNQPLPRADVGPQITLRFEPISSDSFESARRVLSFRENNEDHTIV